MMHRTRRRNPGRFEAGLPEKEQKNPFLWIRNPIPAKSAKDRMRFWKLDRIDVSPLDITPAEIPSDARDALEVSGKMRNRFLGMLVRGYGAVAESHRPVLFSMAEGKNPSKNHHARRTHGTDSYRFLTRTSHIRTSV
jgi:hypothetical protein